MYVVLVKNHVEFETNHLGEAIAFKIGRRDGVLAKVLEEPSISPPLPMQEKRRKPRKK